MTIIPILFILVVLILVIMGMKDDGFEIVEEFDFNENEENQSKEFLQEKFEK